MRAFSLIFTLLCSLLVRIPDKKDIKDQEGERYYKYTNLSKYLDALSDDEMTQLLKEGISLGSGMMGNKIKVEVERIPIFVKLVPLSALEGQAENILSTENLFNLPLYYQYGVGSMGFSVWREVSAHNMTTDWVLAEESQNFPLMYHWRVLHNLQVQEPFGEGELREHVDYWNNSEAIENKIRASYNVSTYVALFIEYIPETLDSWLKHQLVEREEAIDSAVEMVEHDLKEAVTFMNKKGMLHFDAHFQNILTDGKRLYFSDFGLTTSLQFTLTDEEK